MSRAMWSMPMICRARWISLVMVCAVRPSAAEQPSLEKAAAKLQESVVTLRVQPPATGGEKPSSEPVPRRVTVCSGVLLGRGRVVTSLSFGGESTYRVTLPDGTQSAARLRVVDQYSGLSLLEIDHHEHSGISCADRLPPTGAWVVSGAGWGAEKPVISFGIVSGSEIAVQKTTFPPLLRCDLRIAKTSSGAAVVNLEGQLIGIVVLADRTQDHGGWTYAVPVSHVQRLLRSLDESKDSSSLLVLRRRRPIVGMVLDGDGRRVVVSRVREDSPAAKAGIMVGDQVLATEHVKIRSVYQALRPVLRKAPGDRVTFLVERDGRQQEIAVVLGGGVELPMVTPVNLSQLVQPRIDLEGLPHGGVRSSSTLGEVHEMGPAERAVQLPDLADSPTAAQKIQLLEKTLDRYQDVISYLNQQLEKSESQRQQAAARIKQLEEQVRKSPRQ